MFGTLFPRVILDWLDRAGGNYWGRGRVQVMADDLMDVLRWSVTLTIECLNTSTSRSSFQGF